MVIHGTAHGNTVDFRFLNRQNPSGEVVEWKRIGPAVSTVIQTTTKADGGVVTVTAVGGGGQTTSTGGGRNTSSGNSESLSVGAGVGIGVAATAGLVFLVLLGVWLFMRKRKKTRNSEQAPQGQYPELSQAQGTEWYSPGPQPVFQAPPQFPSAPVHPDPPREIDSSPPMQWELSSGSSRAKRVGSPSP
jgi:hypothetical protein